LACDIKKKLDVNVCSFGHLALTLSLHYLVKCRSRSLTIDNNEFILGSACISSKNYWHHKIIENLLLRLHFEIPSWQTEIIHQQRVGAWVTQLLSVLLATCVNVYHLHLCCRRTFWAHAAMKMMWC